MAAKKKRKKRKPHVEHVPLTFVTEGGKEVPAKDGEPVRLFGGKWPKRIVKYEGKPKSTKGKQNGFHRVSFYDWDTLPRKQKEFPPEEIYPLNDQARINERGTMSKTNEAKEAEDG